MGDEDAILPAMFIVERDGVPCEPRPLVVESASFETCGSSYDEEAVRRAFEPTSFSFEARVVDASGIDKMLFPLPVDRPVTMAFEHKVERTRYRHEFIWQYRGERKGAKKPRNRNPTTVATRRTVIPNAVVSRTQDVVSWNECSRLQLGLNALQVQGDVRDA